MASGARLRTIWFFSKFSTLKLDTVVRVRGSPAVKTT